MSFNNEPQPQPRLCPGTGFARARSAVWTQECPVCGRWVELEGFKGGIKPHPERVPEEPAAVARQAEPEAVPGPCPGTGTPREPGRVFHQVCPVCGRSADLSGLTGGIAPHPARQGEGNATEEPR